ncbi:MAG: aminopeptidase [Betaproteobacteria bacterium]|nr:aminopeptidase [Betaproteobacteria bacterium]
MRLAGAFVLALAAPLSGCATVEYYAQAISGHLEVVRRAQPIEEQLRESGTPAQLKRRLERVLVIREFASRELGLPENGSYRRYADIGRAFVIWNVFAAPEFSLAPIQSCFPVAGCVAYRGYFAEADAQAYAGEMRRRGNDVFMLGVPAYSTLGWFDDPVLNTFVHYPEAELARLLFHELAHQVAYARDDTVFNESFAVTVEEEGVRRWLARKGSEEQRAAYEALQARRRAFLSLVSRYREKLAALYGGSVSDEEKRQGKARLFAAMMADYGALKASWGGFAGYDRFLAQGPNNALLASVIAYTELVPAFRALLAGERGELPTFYARVKELARLDKATRQQRLAGLSAK